MRAPCRAYALSRPGQTAPIGRPRDNLTHQPRSCLEDVVEAVEMTRAIQVQYTSLVDFRFGGKEKRALLRNKAHSVFSARHGRRYCPS